MVASGSRGQRKVGNAEAPGMVPKGCRVFWGVDKISKVDCGDDFTIL